ncbi:MAG: DnaJ domain-containing protein [Alphaproteobacteria bacterium]|nr:DnaJ domain-containing protein [Alphaproteobacteria bacterium]MBU1512739.1 DnaJ domain-containing protein [Alphaproteobacteria bacterium]MBU2096118.1 DnaJ domain-containing protein [Alphaproteobacteria bacterium]MBU2152474.1 DnaJ domain-containing protein [Alphaproteobacteria bacterium]MBU2307992.1 DnaJ domain-containing protein [Alphaproteobacteria bacterium]
MTRPAPELSLKYAREVLGVSSASTPAEVRKAFREAAKRAHPDSGGDENSFRQVMDAYQRLQDPLGDRLVQTPTRARPTPDPDLEITPKLALEGGDVDHRMPDGQFIRITLPAGLRSGDKVRAAGAELCVYIRAHDGVLVRGDDLWMTVKVAPGLLKKGGRVSLDTPIGRRSVWIDKKAAERGLVRVEAEGLPARGRRPAGHLFVRLTATAGLADSAALSLLRRFAAAWAA